MTEAKNDKYLMMTTMSVEPLIMRLAVPTIISMLVSSIVMASARQGLFLITILLILNGIFGFTGLQLAQCVTDFCSFFLAIPLLINYF